MSYPSGHAKGQLIGYLQQVFHESTGEPVHAYVAKRNGGYVACSCLVVNHPGHSTGDFWQLEIWSDREDDPKIRFLVDHCARGRQVFVEGKMRLKKGTKDKGKVYPTLVVDQLMAFPSRAEAAVST